MNIRSDSQTPQVLATDLDGTFIPLDGDPDNVQDLHILQQEIHEREIVLCYVTGRHFELVQQAMTKHHLPEPNWIICDVGTTIRRNNGGSFAIVEEYHDHLASIIGDRSKEQLHEQLSHLDGLLLQEDEKQGSFKLSYYVDKDALEDIVDGVQAILDDQNIPWSVIHSVDPFTNDGLIDLLTEGTSKAYALNWWCQYLEMSGESILFAGDSGNDMAVFNSGYRTIMVNNTPDDIVKQVQQAHSEEGWQNRTFHASKKATSGVLEGCQHFGMFNDAN